MVLWPIVSLSRYTIVRRVSGVFGGGLLEQGETGTGNRRCVWYVDVAYKVSVA
jgi:hypothetical protein